MTFRWMSSFAVLLLCVSVMPTAPASGASLTVRMPYEGAAVLAHASPEEDCAGILMKRLGVVCTDIPHNARTMAFSVEDASGLAVGGTYYLYDGAGDYAGSGTHCNGERLAVGGAAFAVIRLEAINGPIVCAAQGKLAQSMATKGFVDVTFR